MELEQTCLCKRCEDAETLTERCKCIDCKITSYCEKIYCKIKSSQEYQKSI